jgi:HNH endonuclease
MKNNRKPKTHYTPWEWIWKFGLSPRCHYCEKPLTLRTATKDHLIPQSRDGSNLIENIVPACVSCNLSKGTRTEEEYWVDISTRIACANTNLNIKTALEDSADERGLLKKVVGEREKVSWAWRNPARLLADSEKV